MQGGVSSTGFVVVGGGTDRGLLPVGLLLELS